MDDRKYSRRTDLLLAIAVLSAFLYSIGGVMQPISLILGIVAATISIWMYFSRHFVTAKDKVENEEQVHIAHEITSKKFVDVLISHHNDAINDALRIQLEILTYLKEPKGQKDDIFEELQLLLELEEVSPMKAMPRRHRIAKPHLYHLQNKKKKTIGQYCEVNDTTPVWA